MLSKNLMLIFLLMLINSHVLVECGHGECIPIVCWHGECDPNYYGILGCKDDNENAKVKEVSFKYTGVGREQFLPNYKTITYIVKLGNKVDDGTIGELNIYPQKSTIPGNPALDYLIWNGESTSIDHEMNFEVNLINTENPMVLGNLSNKLLIGGDAFEFEGPYVVFNIGSVTIEPTDDGRYIHKITVETRANEDMSFRLQLNKKRTTQKVVALGRQMNYLVDKFHMEFTDLSWAPKIQEGKEIEYLEGIKSYDVLLIPFSK